MLQLSVENGFMKKLCEEQYAIAINMYMCGTAQTKLLNMNILFAKYTVYKIFKFYNVLFLIIPFRKYFDRWIYIVGCINGRN